jgi:two-component sensor histidine kinase
MQELLARPTTSEARRQIQMLLADQTTELRYVAALLVTELMGNAIRHAKGAEAVKLNRQGALFSAEIFDSSPDLPAVKGVDAERASGLGLMIVSSLAKNWSAEATETGKVVRFELEITPSGSDC